MTSSHETIRVAGGRSGKQAGDRLTDSGGRARITCKALIQNLRRVILHALIYQNYTLVADLISVSSGLGEYNFDGMLGSLH